MKPYLSLTGAAEKTGSIRCYHAIILLFLFVSAYLHLKRAWIFQVKFRREKAPLFMNVRSWIPNRSWHKPFSDVSTTVFFSYSIQICCTLVIVPEQTIVLRPTIVHTIWHMLYMRRRLLLANWAKRKLMDKPLKWNTTSTSEIKFLVQSNWCAGSHFNNIFLLLQKSTILIFLRPTKFILYTYNLSTSAA
jgi:hypothetical protein